MKKFTQKFIGLFLLLNTFILVRKCSKSLYFTEIFRKYKNMTIFLTPLVINNLPIFEDYPYLVALSPSGLIVGSASLSSGRID